MSISAIPSGAVSSSRQSAPAPTPVQTASIDRDGDHDGDTAATDRVQAALPKGVGERLDVTA